MRIPGRRQLNLAGFVACLGLIGYALYAEHGLGLTPCPLCVFQRIAVIALGIAFLVAAVTNAGGALRFVNAGLVAIAAGGGLAVAGRHVWLQNLPPDRVPACGPDLSYMVDNFPFAEVLQMVLTGSGECAEIDWQFLGLSMPVWTSVCFLLLGCFGVWNNLRRP